MRLRILQHVAYETPGTIRRWAVSRGLAVATTKLYAGEPLPHVGSDEILIVLGGPMSVDDVDAHPFLAAEQGLLREVLAAGGRVLGICLGAQLLARALGARVAPQSHKEIGWWPVMRTADAADVPLLAGVPATLTTFHWHGDACELPRGATRLFSSEGCGMQGFLAASDRALALQFHPEVDAPAVQAMLLHDDHELAAGGAHVQTRAAIEERMGLADPVFPVFAGILDRFCGI